MRKIIPEEVPPICPNCQAMMSISNYNPVKFWECKNECGGDPIPYYEKGKTNRRYTNNKLRHG